jgi:hypothetical protein
MSSILIRSFVVVVFVIYGTMIAFGHGTPITVTLNPAGTGLIASASHYGNLSDSDIENYPLEDIGLFVTRDIPGYDVIGLANNTILNLEILPRVNLLQPAGNRYLWYWDSANGLGNPPNGEQFWINKTASFATQLTITPNTVSPATTINITTFTPAQNNQHLHHLVYSITNDPEPAAAGLYSVIARVTSPGYTASDPFWLTFDWNLTPAEIGQGVLSTIGASNQGTTTLNRAMTLPDNLNWTLAAGTLKWQPIVDNTTGNNSQTTILLGATLELGGNKVILDPTSSITNAGTLNLTGAAQTLGNINGTGAMVVSGAGSSTVPTLLVKDIDQSSLTINNGAYVRIIPNGTSTSVLTSLTLGTTANLDISDNDVVVKNPTPISAASNLAMVAARVNAGFVSGGSGIVTSSSTTGLETVGFGLNNFLSLPTFNGVTVNADSLLIKYTYFGDSNLDGFVTDDDLGYFLAGYGTDVSANPWILGDYNHDGFTTDDDLGYFLAAYGATSGLSSDMIAIIPEPSTWALSLLSISSSYYWCVKRQRNRARQEL